MDITFRFAGPGDIPRLCDLLSELFSLESDFSPDREKQERGLSLLVNDQPGASLILVAVAAETVIGVATIQTLVPTAEGGRVGLVEDVIVDERFRCPHAGQPLAEGCVR